MAYGIDPTRLDTVAQYPLGMEVDDPRTVDFPGNRIRYVRTSEAIGVGRALQMNIGAGVGPPSLRGKEVSLCLATTPLTQVVSAISIIAATAAAQFMWVCVKGLVPNCVVPDALAVGTNVIGGAAGAFVDGSGAGTETAELDYSMASGLRCTLVQDTGTALGTVRID